MTGKLMSKAGTILAISGSTRTGSFNQSLLDTAVAYLVSQGSSCKQLRLNDFSMPFYNGDDEASGGLPHNARALRAEIERSSALLICSPEYNGSIPAILKNAIDWTSRSYDGEPPAKIFRNKLVCLMGASTGDKGALRGLAHLSSVFMNMGALVMPRFFGLSYAAGAFDSSGALLDPRLKKTFEAYLDELVKAVERCTVPKC